MSVFSFVDRVTEVKKGESLTAVFKLKGDEEFLKNHFSAFPVMPGVLLLESLKQAASALLDATFPGSGPYRLRHVEEARFGKFVKPGSALNLSVRLRKTESEAYFFDARADFFPDSSESAPKGRALSAGFSLRSIQGA